MDNYYVSKLLPLIAESGVSVVANPLINITLQGRHDTYPKRRGMTRVPELMAAGVNVAFGHDCVMDPWYGMGSGDMLEVAHMGLHVAQMTSQAGIRQCFDAVTTNAAAVFGLDGYGLDAGLRRELRAAAGARSGGGDPPARDAAQGVPQGQAARRIAGRHGASAPRRSARLNRLALAAPADPPRGAAPARPPRSGCISRAGHDRFRVLVQGAEDLLGALVRALRQRVDLRKQLVDVRAPPSPSNRRAARCASQRSPPPR